MYKTVTSASNPVIKELKGLQKRKNRKSSGSFLIEGYRLVLDAVQNGIIPELLLVRQDKADAFAEILSRCGGTDVLLVSEAVIQALSMTESPEGIMARVRIPQEHTEGDENTVIVLDGIQDPGNLGTILRTANSAGIHDIYFLGDNVDMYNPKVVRSAMGAVFLVRPHYCASAEQLYAHLRARGYSVCATVLSGRDFYSTTLPERIALVLGNEGNGISRESLDSADYRLTLPMAPGAESLNVAVCAGIMIFDIIYRR